jgi:hypothetical protein
VAFYQDGIRIGINMSNTHYGSLVLKNEKDREIAIAIDIDDTASAALPMASQRFVLSRDTQERPAAKVIRFYLRVLALAFGTLLVLLCPLFPVFRGRSGTIRNHGDRLATTLSVSSVTTSLTSTTSASAANTTAAAETETAPPPRSPFFEHVLEWREMPLTEAPSDYDHNYNNSGTTDPATSNHYKASIEFCSDPDKGIFGYGPVGNCVPGRAAPLIRINPKRCVALRTRRSHAKSNFTSHFSSLTLASFGFVLSPHPNAILELFTRCINPKMLRRAQLLSPDALQ